MRICSICIMNYLYCVTDYFTIYVQKSVKKLKESTSEPPLSPSTTSDSSLEVSLSAEYDERGWLDCNPEAKMELENLDKEECISDDEVEVMPSSAVCTELGIFTMIYIM